MSRLTARDHGARAPHDDAFTSGASLEDAATLRALVRNLPHGVCLTSPGGEFLDANPAFLAMLGVATIDELRKQRVASLVVDPEQREQALAALKPGVRPSCELDHWLIRPDGELRAVVETVYLHRDRHTGEPFHLAIVVDVTDRRALERQLIELSVRDALTGCYNRRYLEDTGRMLNTRVGATWGCIFVDVDHFKQYNDTHGHDAGDEALIRVSRFLLRQVRAEDAVVRLGGDEFLVVLAGADAARAGAVAKRLQQAARSNAPVPFSLGWAARVGAETFDQTISRADQNLLAVRVLERTPDRQRRVDGWVGRDGRPPAANAAATGGGGPAEKGGPTTTTTTTTDGG